METNFTDGSSHALLHTSSLDRDLSNYPALRGFFVACLGMQSTFGSIGNLLVIGAVLIMEPLRQPGNAFFINLALADLCVTAVAQPANILGAVFGEQFFAVRPSYCALVSTFCTTGCLASCWNMCMIAVNRYVLICRYHLYDRIYTKANTFLLCLFCWLTIYLIQMPNHLGWGDLRFQREYYVCTFANHVHSYALFYILLGVYFPLAVCFICYTLIYLRVKDSRLYRARLMSTKARERRDTEAAASPMAKLVEELHVIQTMFRVLIMFVAMWMPLGILILIGTRDHIEPVWYILALLSAHGNSSINCLVYAMSIDHFRDGYRKLLGCRWLVKDRDQAMRSKSSTHEGRVTKSSPEKNRDIATLQTSVKNSKPEETRTPLLELPASEILQPL